MGETNILFIIQIINAIACLIGFGIFVRSFIFALKITDLLKETRIVKQWRFATFLVGLFSLGYLLNIILVFIVNLETLLIVEAIVFFFGAIFVLIVFRLAYKTYDLIYSIP